MNTNNNKSNEKNKNQEHYPTEILNRPDLKNICFDKNGNIFKDIGIIHSLNFGLRSASSISYPYINIDELDNLNGKSQKIISNYGQAGGGWTLSWGCILKGFESFDFQTELIENQKKVSVIGMGIYGLATSLALIEHGVNPKNITLYIKDLNILQSGSFHAGAIFSCQVADSNPRKDFSELMIESFKIWKNILYFDPEFPVFPNKNELINKNSPKNEFRETNKNPKNIIPWHKFSPHMRWINYYTGADKEAEDGLLYAPTGTEPVINAGLLDQVELKKVKFENSSKEYLIQKSKTIYFNTYDIINNALQILRDLGVNFINQEITDVQSQISDEYVFNCCGSESFKISSHFEGKSYPICGHMINFKKTEIEKTKDLDYAFLGVFKITKNSEPGYIIYMPKKGPGFDYCIGGSKIKHYFGEDAKFNMENWNYIIDQAKIFYDSDDKKSSLHKPILYKDRDLRPKF